MAYLLWAWHASHMLQSLVTIGQAISEIRRQKKNKEDLIYSGKTEWPAVSIAGRFLAGGHK